jgi:hypothetical protein
VERVEWVTPLNDFNSHPSTFGTQGDYKPYMCVVCADLVMFVRIGKAGERLAYPSMSQIKEEWERMRENRTDWSL